MINVLDTYSVKFKFLLTEHIKDSVREMYGIPYKKLVSRLAYNYCLIYGLEMYLLDNDAFTQAELLSIISAITIPNCCGTVQLLTPTSISNSCSCKGPAPVYFTGAAIDLDEESDTYLEWIHTAYAGNTSFMLALDGGRFLVPWVEFTYLTGGGVKFTGFIPEEGNIFVALP